MVISLAPYPTLALFTVPVIVLEPAKPIAAYLAATGHVASGVLFLGAAELLKLLLIERLFSISQDKLMSIPAFAWGYGNFQQARSWVKSLTAWRMARRVALAVKRAIQRYSHQFRESRNRKPVSWQSR